MKIDSSSHGYQYPARSQAVERSREEAGPREAEQQRQSGSTLTGSSTLLSSSLANALWVMGDGGREAASTAETSRAANGVTADWVEDLYLEFSEN